MTQTTLTHTDTITVDAGLHGGQMGDLRRVEVATTWHATSAEAQSRVAGVAGRLFGKVFPGGVLGKFRAVTWVWA